ncbi:MAG: NfeD family protein [Dehalococcoidales bacterium]|nr:NfeD family protein [Dehalococcoidales bacterium]
MNLTGDIVIDPWVIVLIILCIIAFLAITIIWGIRAHRFKIGAGKEEMIGKTALVTTALDPKGTVFVEGEQWTAISEEDRIEPGEEVTISRVDGLKIYVTKIQ